MNFVLEQAIRNSKHCCESLNNITDSGDRTVFSTGAVRDMHAGKGRMDLLPWEALLEVSKHCEEGALKYGERNCEKGIPMLDDGCTPQEARSVLPTSLKTEVVMTANLREWRHFLRLRCSPAAHPQMREVACLLLRELCQLVPVVFDDIAKEVSQRAD